MSLGKTGNYQGGKVENMLLSEVHAANKALFSKLQ